MQWFCHLFSMIMGVGEGGIGDKRGLASLPTFISYIFGGHLTLPDGGFFWNLERTFTFTTPKHRLWHCTPVPSPPGWQLKKISPLIFDIFQPVKSATFCFNLEILRRVEVRFLGFEWSRKNRKFFKKKNLCNQPPADFHPSMKILKKVFCLKSDCAIEVTLLLHKK